MTLAALHGVIASSRRAATYASTVAALNPIAWWRFGESAGTTAVDETGNGHDGTYTGTFSLAQTGLIARDSNTAVLVGQGGVVVPDSAALQLVGAMSLVIWVKAYGAANPNGFDWFIAKCINNGGGSNAYEWRVSNAGSIQFSQGGGSTINGTTALDEGTHMLGVTRSGGAGSTIKHYLDGAANGSGTLGETPDASSGHSVYIGGRDDFGVQAQFAPMDEAAIFGVELSASDMAAIYNAGV